MDGGEWNGDGFGVGEGMRKERVKEQQSDCSAGVQSWAGPFVAEPARPAGFRGKTGSI